MPSLILIYFVVLAIDSGAFAALSTNPIAPTEVNICESNGFVVYINNNGTTSENEIHLNVTIPSGFSYENGTTSITFPNGSSNEEPEINGQYLEWNLTEIMTTEIGVVINEVLPNPIDGNDGAQERVELYNAGSTAVNVGGWYINDTVGNKRDIQSYILSGSVNMAPGSFLVISIRYLDDGGDKVILYDNLGNQIDLVEYNDSSSHIAESWACMPDGSENWDWGDSTLFATNGDLAAGELIEVEFNLTTACGTLSGERIWADVFHLGGSDSRSSTSMLVKEGFLNLAKTPTVVEAGVGDVVNWTITVENTGLGPAYNVRVNDTLSSGLSLLGIDSPNSSMNWTYDVIGPGELKAVNISVEVVFCEDLNNEVNANWGCGGTPCQQVYANSSVSFIPRDPGLNYTVSPMVVPYCGNVTVRVNVSNPSLGDISVLKLQFSGISADYAVSNVSGAVYHSGNETFYLGGIPQGNWSNFTFDFGVACGDRCVKGAHGTVTIYPHHQDDCGNTWLRPVTQVSYSMDPATIPSIDVEKTADGFLGSSGARVNFTILVTNTGNVTLDPVTVTDTLPLGLDDPVPSVGGSVTGNVVTWSLGRLNESDTRTLWLEAHINSSAFGELSNVVIAEGDPEIGDNVTDEDIENITALGAEIDVEKTVDIPVGSTSTRVNFTIVVNNIGNADLDHVIVTDTLPYGLDDPVPSIGGTVSGNLVTWDLGSLNVSDIRTVWLEAHINGSALGNLTNLVDVEAKPKHGDNVTDNDSVNVTALGAEIDVEKTVDKPVTKNGMIVNFTIVVNNTGDADLDPVIMTDNLPFCFEYVSSTHNGSESGGVVTWNLGRLNKSDSKAIVLKALVNCSEAGVVTNLVEVEGKPEHGDNVTANDTADVTTIYDFDITKTPDKDVVRRGEEITYTINICNEGADAYKVLVKDVFDRTVLPVSISYSWTWTGSPAPRIEKISEGVWLVDMIPSKGCIEITLTVRVPKQELEFGMDQGVAGTGFVNVNNDYSTTLEPYVITNRVVVTLNGTDEEFGADARVSVLGEPGTELSTRERGSGSYESEEQVRLISENKSISMDKDVAATFGTTTLGLYHNRTLNYSSRWTEVARAKNRITGASMSESYRYATRIDRESSLDVDKNGSTLTIDSEFEGMGHIGFLKKDPRSGAKSTPTFEAREEYAGSFKVLEKVDQYGSSVSSEKSASGAGLVVVDKRVGESQRSYESGTGAYESEELIRTQTNYFAKDITLENAPASLDLSGNNGTKIYTSMLWKEGMYSKTPATSYIGEEYTGVTRLEKETVAFGLNEMDTSANFSGRARYRAVLEDDVDFDEEYEGDYSIERRVLFTGVPKYGRPHLNVVKSGSLAEETILDAKEEILAGESRDKTIKVATYTIALENDGNKALGPVYVRDLFPPEAVYINSSVRSAELTETYANWTLTHLAVGDVSTIVLNLDVTKYHPDELVNRVFVTAGYDGDKQIAASNFSALEVEWLTCCSNQTIYASKTAELDLENPNVVWYKVEIKNGADVTRVATVTDSLPAGMVLIDSTVPFASCEMNTVTWNMVEIGPFETATIIYRAEVQHAGRFVNSVQVDARSVDGPIVQPVRASSVIDVGEVEDCEKASCSTWSPPAWGLQSPGQTTGIGCDQLVCEEK